MTNYRFAIVEYDLPWLPPRVLAYYPYPQAAYSDFPHIVRDGGWHKPLGLMYVEETRLERGVTP